MPSSRSRRSIYAKIPLEKRQNLVRLVLQKHLSIAKAGRRLSIKPSTAKLIVKKYRQTGQFFVKKSPKYGDSQSEISSEDSQISQEEEYQGNVAAVGTENTVEQNCATMSYIYYPNAFQAQQSYFYSTTYHNNFLFFYY